MSGQERKRLAPVDDLSIIRPPYAYLPGRMGRHPGHLFERLRASIRPGMGIQELADSAAFQAGLVYLRSGFYWEAHEVLEPVWQALPPSSRERQFTQALIQLANAGVKQRLGRAAAFKRLREKIIYHLEEARRGFGELILGVSPDWALRLLQQIEINQKMHYNA